MTIPPIASTLPAGKPEYNDEHSIEETGYITKQAKGMQTGVVNSKAQLEQAKLALEKDPSSPSALARYQSALSEYNLYRNAQSNMVKAYKDIGSAIITNFKN